MTKVLNVQFVVDVGDEKKETTIVEELKRQMKLQNHLLPRSVKVLYGEEIRNDSKL